MFRASRTEIHINGTDAEDCVSKLPANRRSVGTSSVPHFDRSRLRRFFDFDGLGAGSFEIAILENIRARAHFILILTPKALLRCSEPGDWLRREISEALKTRRIIVPLLVDGFTFSSPEVKSPLTGLLAPLSRYNGLHLPNVCSNDYFDAAIKQLEDKYSNIPPDAVPHPASAAALEAVSHQRDAAIAAVKLKEPNELDLFVRNHTDTSEFKKRESWRPEYSLVLDASERRYFLE